MAAPNRPLLSSALRAFSNGRTESWPIAFKASAAAIDFLSFSCALGSDGDSRAASYAGPSRFTSTGMEAEFNTDQRLRFGGPAVAYGSAVNEECGCKLCLVGFDRGEPPLCTTDILSVASMSISPRPIARCEADFRARSAPAPASTDKMSVVQGRENEQPAAISRGYHPALINPVWRPALARTSKAKSRSSREWLADTQVRSREALRGTAGKAT
ncbi:MAG: hypothetical protein RLY70_3891, partial [Planctomycetota bacterium]